MAIKIRGVKKEEIKTAANILATAYKDDAFFHWCVDDDQVRHEIVVNYYSVYLNSPQCIAHVAAGEGDELLGVAVWLPDDVEEVVHEQTSEVVGIYAPQFDLVGEKSYANEPKGIQFYQLYGFGVKKGYQGQGIGRKLLAHQLNLLDQRGIPTYLEASTPFNGDGIYSKFGYDIYGELMYFTEDIVLYPLFRPAGGNMMKKTAFICDESFFWHNAGESTLFEPAGGYLQASGSAESPESKRRFKNLLERSGLMEQLVQIKPIPATETQLLTFHTQRHIDNVKFLSDGPGGDCGDSAIVGRGSYEIAKLSAGGAITAVKAVVEDENIKNVYALTRPPGHHAEADQGMGYCIFNNVVVATKYAQKELGIKKIAIIDWDAHHGNGTEDAFYEDDSVLFISLHQDNLEPIGRGKMTDIGRGKGEGYTINIPLFAGSGDAVYAYAFDEIVAPVIEKFEPELIIVSAGQDASIFDPLARMMMSAEGYRLLTEKVMDLARKFCEGRLVLAHEGGYSEEYVPFCSHAIVEELAGIKTDVEDPFIYAVAGTSYDTLLEHQKQRVDEIKEFLKTI